MVLVYNLGLNPPAHVFLENRRFDAMYRFFDRKPLPSFLEFAHLLRSVVNPNKKPTKPRRTPPKKTLSEHAGRADIGVSIDMPLFAPVDIECIIRRPHV